MKVVVQPPMGSSEAIATEFLSLRSVTWNSSSVPWPRAAGTRAVEAFLAAHASVTAVAAFDDNAAIRILTAPHDLRLSAPGDLPAAFSDSKPVTWLTRPGTSLSATQRDEPPGW